MLWANIFFEARYIFQIAQDKSDSTVVRDSEAAHWAPGWFIVSI